MPWVFWGLCVAIMTLTLRLHPIEPMGMLRVHRIDNPATIDQAEMARWVLVGHEVIRSRLDALGYREWRQ